MKKKKQKKDTFPRGVGLNNFYYPDEKLRRRQNGVMFQAYDLDVVGDDLSNNDIYPDDLNKIVPKTTNEAPSQRFDDI
ncbi:MAG: hypothetical protein A2Y17_13590 [Clostridiales bacterium GWF2_38_85]|nr:MAG: hypothetical protein A2Y17_13590 [Clostridiales bacterium GWF2_38_85]